MSEEKNKTLKEITKNKYQYGFVSKIETEKFEPGLNEKIISLISNKRKEPKWMLDYRLKAYKILQNMKVPDWANLNIKPIDLQKIIYFAAPKKNQYKSLDEVDPELLKTFNKLGISIDEQKKIAGVAIDVVVDSVSVATTFQDTLKKLGIIFCSMSEAIKNHPDLVKKYLGSVVPSNDNNFAALNAAEFTEGSFCYIPEGVKCTMELSTYSESMRLELVNLKEHY